jgi:hypothetical protein
MRGALLLLVCLVMLPLLLVQAGIYAAWYFTRWADEEKLLNRLSIATIANLVGESTISIAAKHNYINEDCVLMIAGVPHAQMVKM